MRKADRKAIAVRRTRSGLETERFFHVHAPRDFLAWKPSVPWISEKWATMKATLDCGGGCGARARAKAWLGARSFARL
eukprot:5711481-Pleurochrysis_carterae.AAC.1